VEGGAADAAGGGGDTADETADTTDDAADDAAVADDGWTSGSPGDTDADGDGRPGPPSGACPRREARERFVIGRSIVGASSSTSSSSM
jgi:hypothetical protein